MSWCRILFGKAPPELVKRLEGPGFGRKVTKCVGSQLSRFLKNRYYASQQALFATIGNGVVLAANAVITCDVAENEIVGGVSARRIVIRNLRSE